MPFTRRRGSVQRGRTQRRKLVWARSVSENSTVTVAAPLAIDMMADFAAVLGADSVGCTIMRIRGEMVMRPSTTVTGALCGAVGFKIGDAAELLLPVQLGPSTNDRYGAWFGYVPVVFTGSGALPAPVTVPVPLRYQVDVRAKRKLDELRQTLIMAADATAGSTQGYQLGWNLSVLIALP